MSLLDSIIGAESGGNPNASNPNSSASGLGQFIDSTWLDMVRRYRPDLAQGKSDAELIALKSDPALSREMTGAYANQNADFLKSSGFSATPGNTYLAHFAGPSGAVAVLSNPGAPVSQTLGQRVIAANPFAANMTGADLISWAAKKMGDAGASQPPMGGVPAASAPPQSAAAAGPGMPEAPQSAPPPATSARPLSLAGLLTGGRQVAMGDTGAAVGPRGLQLPGGLAVEVGAPRAALGGQQQADAAPEQQPLSMAGLQTRRAAFNPQTLSQQLQSIGLRGIV